MALLEALTLQLGPVIAKAILKLWLKDTTLDIASSVVDLIKTRVTNVQAQQRGRRHFEDIGERVAESLMRLCCMNRG